MTLVSAHDSTIVALMTSLGPRVWNLTDFPFYASMMIIEVRILHYCIAKWVCGSDLLLPLTIHAYFQIHALLQIPGVANHSSLAFRLIYNGQVLTSLIEGCPAVEGEDLCDVSVLRNILSDVATRHLDCEVKVDHTLSPSTGTRLSSVLNELFSSRLIGYTIMSLVFSAFVGAMLSCWYVRRVLPSHSIQEYEILHVSQGEEEMSVMT